ncbi:CopG family transcriptional regulator [Lichenicola cladoniae]|uniref:CopG family transcriptional regulator n=1 Tax=Lichenicola cladoniae TaxID=1484109 RepID=A0A6M8HMM7_9PROT|nr:CopG family transcriptional regulator [Lichenicola cladoniae]NPD67017.1 CopG family transcriptional regulator [Acetobacteraceae bacterium]QKE89566.1 CopG family transcriptional regulator [Lichenicola cladoniae]
MTDGAVEDAVTVKLDHKNRAELDALAQLTSRDPSFLIDDAIAIYLAAHRWPIARIADGLHQAEAGDFPSPEEVDAGYARWV